MRVTLLGVRGSIPTPGPRFVRYGGNTSCVAVARDREMPTLLLDAGSGLATTGPLFGAEPFRGSILLSHLHWDQVYGLPFFGPGDHRRARVRLYLPAQGDPYEALAQPLSPPTFPIDLYGLRGEWQVIGLEPGLFEAEGFRVLAAEIPHIWHAERMLATRCCSITARATTTVHSTPSPLPSPTNPASPSPSRGRLSISSIPGFSSGNGKGRSGAGQPGPDTFFDAGEIEAVVDLPVSAGAEDTTARMRA